MGDFLSLEGAAERLDVPESTLRQWIRRGRARATRRAGAYLIREREVERLLKRMAREDTTVVESRSRQRPISPPTGPAPGSEPEAPEPEPEDTSVPEAELERSQGELARLQKELEERTDALEQAVTELEELRKEPPEDTGRQAELEELRAQLARTQGELEVGKERFERGRVELAEVERGLLQDAENERRDWQHRERELSRALEETRTAHQVACRDGDAAVRARDELQQECSQLGQRCQELDELLLEWQDRARGLEHAFGDQRKRVGELEGFLDSASREQSILLQLEDRLSSATRIRDELERRIRSLELEREELLAEHVQLRGRAEEAAEHARDARLAKERLEDSLAELHDKWHRAQGRMQGLEREISVSSARWEEREAQLEAENRQLKDQLNSLQFKVQMAGEGGSVASLAETRGLVDRVGGLEEQMLEKDRLIEDGHLERSHLRSQLEDQRRDFYELQQRYEQEKNEWSSLVAHQMTKDRDKLMEQTKKPEKVPKESLLGWFRPKGDLP